MSLSQLLYESKLAEEGVDELRNMVEWQYHIHRSTALIYGKVFGNSPAPSLNLLNKRRITNGVSLYLEVQNFVNDFLIKKI